MGMQMETRNKRNGVADAAQAARGFGENGGGTSITTTGTGEREEQRRACCTSEAVPAPPGKAITSTAALKQSRVDARLRPDEITTTASDDDDRAMGQRRRRQEARKRQCSGLGHCSRGQAHGLQSKQTGQVVREIHCRRRWARGLWR